MKNLFKLTLSFLTLSMMVNAGEPSKGRILIRADQVTNKISRLTIGACLEDVNHEVYGGIYSQMIFGESFEEPAPAIPVEGFMYEGPGYELSTGTLPWTIHEGILNGPVGQGPKLLAKDTKISEGCVEVELFFDNRSSGVAGLIVAVNRSGPGADHFDGYEISLDPQKNQIILGKHQQNWQPISRIDCPLLVATWTPLRIDINRDRIQVAVNGISYVNYTDPDPLPAGSVGFRTWGREAKYRNLQIQTLSSTRKIPFQYEVDSAEQEQVSKMWTGFRRGNTIGSFVIEKNNPISGLQSQRLILKSGNGQIGIANSGLNHRGMAFEKDRDYEGILWARAEKPVSLLLSLESGDGMTRYSETKITVSDSAWQRFEFTMISSGQDTKGRFSIALSEPGSVAIGYCFLQPGEWGRFKGLPVRLDVAQGLIDQQLTVLRYGGCMANASEYRWKNMVGPRDLRPPYKGWWYPYSSNGWGIIDFIDFCEAADFECVPDFNIEETPEDMADFVDYIHSGPETIWGRKRIEAGHPQPYHIKYIQIGNEETVDSHYVDRFKQLAAAIWSKDPDIIPIVGDFAYNDYISDPYNFDGAPRIRTLTAQQEILRFAQMQGKPVWFDVHIWNDEPRDPDRLDKGIGGMMSYVNALKRIGEGADFKVCVFEENANNHRLRRGLGHAHAINEIQRYTHEMPILCAANCLQPDGHNDNGWDQGLLFLNQSRVWGQPSYYITQMISRSYQPLCVESFIDSYQNSLDVTACRSVDGKVLSLRVVNLDRWDITTEITLLDYTPDGLDAQLLQIKGDLNQRNTAEHPKSVICEESKLLVDKGVCDLIYTFPAYSFTVINFK